MKNFCDSPKTNKLRNKINKTFSGLSFDEETHTYTLNGKQLISTTTYLKRFSEAFNSYHASEAKGRKKLKENANDLRVTCLNRDLLLGCTATPVALPTTPLTVSFELLFARRTAANPAS